MFPSFTLVLASKTGYSLSTEPQVHCSDYSMNDTSSNSFLVDSAQYRGPIELLLYLVRRSEVEIEQISIHEITQQYLAYLDVLQQIDINLVGDFLEIASLLVEAKMRAVLPRTDLEDPNQDTDPREDLVQRLLLYKEFKDVSVLLEEQSRDWQNRYPRLANDLPPRKIDMAEQPIQEVELWDLVSSFGRLLRTSKLENETSIVLDDTPIHVYMQQIHQRLAVRRQLQFSELFEPGMHKSAMVGIFLAILELTRYHNVRTEQIGEHGDIRILAGASFDAGTKIEGVVDY